MDVHLRPVREGDAPAMNRIHSYYVQNTVITFMYEPYTQDETRDGIVAVREANLPYIVAVDADAQVLGYISAMGFRASKRGYWHSIEINLFCDPQHTGKGVGSALMTTFLSVLREPEAHAEFVPDLHTFRAVRQVVAGMAIDVEGPRRGMALKEFYERFGFVERGNMPQIGFKFERWIDVLFMQLSLW